MTARTVSALSAALALGLLSLPACSPVIEESEPPFPTETIEYSMGLVVDDSGSFTNHLEQAFTHADASIRAFARSSIDRHNHVTVSQISQAGRSVLFADAPARWRKKCPSGREFRDLILKESGFGSPICASITATIDEMLTARGFTEGKSKALLLVYSDLEASDGADAQSGQRVREALRRFAKGGGFVGLYFVDKGLVVDWRRILEEEGFARNQFCVSSEVTTPPVPRFGN